MGLTRKRVVAALLALGGITATAAWGWGVERILDWAYGQLSLLAQLSRQDVVGSLGLLMIALGGIVWFWPGKREPAWTDAVWLAMQSLADDLAIKLERNSMVSGRPWPEVIADAYAMRIRLEKHDFRTPRFEEGIDPFAMGARLHQYIVGVAALIRDGNINEARALAEHICAGQEGN